MDIIPIFTKFYKNYNEIFLAIFLSTTKLFYFDRLTKCDMNFPIKSTFRAET